MSEPARTTPLTTHRSIPGTQFTRFVLVGPVGVGLGALQYELHWLLNPLGGFRASSTWLLSSLIGVTWVHALHCHFTFGTTARGRWRATLARAYALYSASIALGTLGMWLLADELSVRRTPAWLLTTTATSLFNFFFLRRLLGAPSKGRADRDRRMDDAIDRRTE